MNKPTIHSAWRVAAAALLLAVALPCLAANRRAAALPSHAEAARCRIEAEEADTTKAKPKYDDDLMPPDTVVKHPRNLVDSLYKARPEEYRDGTNQQGNPRGPRETLTDASLYRLDNRFHAWDNGSPWSDKFTAKWYDHIFLSAGIGLTQTITAPDQQKFNSLTTVDLGVGKQFNKLHSVRLNLHLAYGYQQAKNRTFGRVGISADHLFSLTTFFNGYRPDRFIDVSSVLGVGMSKQKLGSGLGSAWAFDGHAGLQFKFFTGPQGYFAIEPYFGIGSDQMDLSRGSNWRRVDLYYGAYASFIYYINNNLSAEARERYRNTRLLREDYARFQDQNISEHQRQVRLDSLVRQSPWFFEMSNGIVFGQNDNLSVGENLGRSLTVSGGKWLSRALGVRLSFSTMHTVWSKSVNLGGDAGLTRRWNSVYRSASIEALVNPLGFRKHFSWEDRFGFYVFGGAGIGMLQKFQVRNMSCRSESYSAGLHGWVRLGERVSAFIEPRFMHQNYKMAYNNVPWNQRFSDNNYGVNIGLSFTTRGRFLALPTQPDADADRGWWRHITAGVGGGLNFVQSKSTYEGSAPINYNALVFGEYHITNIHGVRLSFEMVSVAKNAIAAYYYLNTQRPDEDYLRQRREGLWQCRTTMGAVSLSYVCNLSRLFYGWNADRLLNVSVYGGPSLYFNLMEGGTIDAAEHIAEGHRVELVSRTQKPPVKVCAHAGAKIAVHLPIQISGRRPLEAFFQPTIYFVQGCQLPHVETTDTKIVETLTAGLQWNF